jgi:hypothetical protein
LSLVLADLVALQAKAADWSALPEVAIQLNDTHPALVPS